MAQPSFAVALLDDDPSVLKALTRLLRSAGLTVAAFLDPHVFLEHAAKNLLAVAVLDVCMPAMNGLEVQSRLRDLSAAPEIVFLSSLEDPAAREQALAAGAFAFLRKPADDEELLSVIQLAAAQTGYGGS